MTNFISFPDELTESSRRSSTNPRIPYFQSFLASSPRADFWFCFSCVLVSFISPTQGQKSNGLFQRTTSRLSSTENNKGWEGRKKERSCLQALMQVPVLDGWFWRSFWFTNQTWLRCKLVCCGVGVFLFVLWWFFVVVIVFFVISKFFMHLNKGLILQAEKSWENKSLYLWTILCSCPISPSSKDQFIRNAARAYRIFPVPPDGPFQVNNRKYFSKHQRAEVWHRDVQPKELLWAQQLWTKLNFCLEAYKAIMLVHQGLQLALSSLIWPLLGPKERKLYGEGADSSSLP